ncbi:YjjG family noncanonical pyrimidine nucleotidase [Lysinibacillus sp. 54212]|uniref:YjjG family noncanonical pyrimidine nucleotidase n=1 Tax=Lysinibacillus sp. 54212 TaxID=3119829 RepID=UPI002FCB9362
MKKYRNLLFDLDDTLLDFQAAEKQALVKLFESENIPFSPTIKNLYKEINEKLWHKFEREEISREQVIETRFTKLFEVLGKKADGALLDKKYREYIAESTVFIEGAAELISTLKDQYALYIVTNGISETQYKRLQRTGLGNQFQNVFVSEDTGYQKPMIQYFEYVFQRIPDFKKEQTLIIGDSFSADIVGGYGAGIDTCWLNSNNKTNSTSIQPTYEIRSLSQLYSIL